MKLLIDFIINFIFHYFLQEEFNNLLLIEYRNYLNQTIFILEEDEEFQKLVSNITEEDLKVKCCLNICCLGKASVKN